MSGHRTLKNPDEHHTLNRCQAKGNRKAGSLLRNERPKSVVLALCSADGLVIEYGGAGITEWLDSVDSGPRGRPVSGGTVPLKMADREGEACDLVWQGELNEKIILKYRQFRDSNGGSE